METRDTVFPKAIKVRLYSYVRSGVWPETNPCRLHTGQNNYHCNPYFKSLKNLIACFENACTKLVRVKYYLLGLGKVYRFKAFLKLYRWLVRFCERENLSVSKTVHTEIFE